MSPQTIFLLGATGYLGSEFLILLAEAYPDHSVNALVRNVTNARKAELQKIHPNLTVTEGYLDDASVIEEAVLKADIVINMASSDHWPSVKGKYMAVWRRRYASYTDVTNSYSRWAGEKLK